MGCLNTNTGSQASAASGEMIGFAGQYGFWTDNETYTTASSGAPQRRFPWVWMGHREYDPLACRFLTRDPIDYDGGINLYAYCGNNPIMFADPSGFQPPPLSSVTTPHGQLEMAELAAEAAEAIPKPVFPSADLPAKLIAKGANYMGKTIIGWGSKGVAALQLLRNLKAQDINRMRDGAMNSEAAQKLADFYYRQYQYMRQQNPNNPVDTPLQRFRLMEVVAQRLRFLEKLQGK